MTVMTNTRRRSLRLAALLFSLGSIVALGCQSTTPTAARTQRDFGPTGFSIDQALQVSSSARSDFDEAVRALEAEEWIRAIELLESVLEEEPESSAAHVNLALALAGADRLEDAEASLQRALEHTPRHPGVLNELALIQRRRGRFSEARANYEAALELQPNFHFARRNLAILCDLYLADLECALTHYERYAELFPEDESVAMWISDIRNRIGR